MSLCKSGAIIANSTFSWWGAFLGAHESKSPILYPKTYFDNSQMNTHIKKMYPDEWIKV